MPTASAHMKQPNIQHSIDLYGGLRLLDGIHTKSLIGSHRRRRQNWRYSYQQLRDSTVGSMGSRSSKRYLHLC